MLSSCTFSFASASRVILTTFLRSNHNGVDAGVLTLPLADAVFAETSTGQDVRISLSLARPQELTPARRHAS